MNHVTQVVGGLNSQEKVIGQEGRVFTLVPKARQEEAAKFLVENAFATPIWMIDPEILRRIEANGALAADSHRAEQRAEFLAERSAFRAADRATGD